ncbi:DNA mismatch repair enzyme MutH [Sulfurimonas denitrificans DSM 1251]|uniref:DNA mismatch repair enzyme MutH n=1 Tax=Sulfurimonas denitrificans (strain ATCC 33889 / DSM 1251) TaxID=326298 RepID=Q30PF3_SULDN|nr:Sau3AI family type II restriction endonuclease [Sulfurimonas denitrificans]ABB45128.1 DNA mismatch repair enzyme MutH [Sulfurimonas denitrificans DSM 1251]MDD3442805.1 Sau3AI family type II restriction endonuclease [Sulfurimonas denitrificans]
MELPYDIFNKQSIIEFAKKLKSSTLKKSCNKTILSHEYSGKGSFGQILEKFYFLYAPNSNAEADFPEVNLELKSSPLKQLKNNQFRAKERLSLNIINYQDIVHQNFETSSFWKKNENLLLVFYLYENDTNVLDYVIKLVDEWTFPSIDLEIIKQDWKRIKQKVLDGKAHELSEGDTFYLGAAPKGGKGGNPREQPNSTLTAKQRAYSLKQGYVNHIIASISGNSSVYGKLIQSTEITKDKTLEEIVVSKFESYYDKTIEDILAMLNINLNLKAKNFYANLTKAILGIELNKEIEEFEKAEIIVKTIRLKDNNLPKEDISFPNFKYENIVNETWDESEISNILGHKFLFVFFQFENKKLIFKKAQFWNMPYKDILEVEKVWARTKEIVQSGDIVKDIKTNKSGNKIRYTNFPNKKFNAVSHVRPHAINADDTISLPVRDKLTHLKEYTKHCFWLNASYVKNEIYLKSL